MYHRSLDACLMKMRDLKEQEDEMRKVSILVGTHNEETVRHVINGMRRLGITPEQGIVSFGQLYGMWYT